MKSRRCFVVSVWILAMPATILTASPDVQPPDAEVVSRPLHFDVNLVQVDAVVTDSHGRRISGLRAEDFDVLQDGKRQQITHFLWVPGEEPTKQGSPAPPVPMLIKRSEARRVFLVYIDDRVMTFAAFVDVRKALRKLIEERFQPGDLWAFFRTSGGTGAWQKFSSDPQELRAALDHLTYFRVPQYLQNPQNLGFTVGRALRALADLPGRKAFVFVNAGVIAREDAHVALAAGNSARRLFPIAQHLADDANRVSAAIYNIDARGLSVIGPESDTSYGLGGNAPRNGNIPAQETLNRQLAYSISLDMPSMMADLTGGLTFHDTNDLAGAFQKIGEDERGYYLLGWDPRDKDFERTGRQILYHSLRIRVNKAGLKVRTRKGYFGVPEGNRARVSARSRMTQAITTPFREDDISVDVTASIQESEALGPHMECMAHIGPMGMDWMTDRNGCKVTHLDIAVVRLRLGEDADYSGVRGQLATIQACGQSAETAMKEGFVYAMHLNTAPGPYEMRVLVRSVEPGEGPVPGQKRLITDSDPTNLKPPAHIGSASEFVDAPDLRKSSALSGITLGLDGKPAPPAAGTTSWHLAEPGDPAIRDFHAGDVITYKAQILGEKDRSLPFGADVKVLCEGKEIYTQMIQAEGNTLEGVYYIDEKAPAGQYLLGIVIPGKGGKDRGAREEWINFQVVKGVVRN